MPRRSSDRKKRATEVSAWLAQNYADSTCALIHESPLQLLIATILSAQCTDQRVNQVTPALFSKFPTAKHFADAPLHEVEALIQSTGFFRNKAKNIIACCTNLVREHHGEVPKDLEQLVKLPGVGRKTANVVLGTAYGIPSGVVVDTHVARLSQRMGLTDSTQPEKIEQDLMALLPIPEWIDFSHRMIWHGRRVCDARKPLCLSCGLNNLCPKQGLTAIKAKVRSDKQPSRQPPKKSERGKSVMKKKTNRRTP